METKTLVQAFETELNLTEQGFKELTERKKGLVIDIKTDDGFKLARKERTEQNNLIKDIDRLAIDGKNDIDEVRNKLKVRVVKIFAPTVNAFEAENLRRKEEAAKAARLEEERIQAIHDQINSIREFSTNLIGKTSEELQGIIEAVDMIDVSENFSEFTQEAMQVKKETLGDLNLALSSAIQNEQLAADREKLRKEQAEQKEKIRLDDLKAKSQERLNNLIMIPSTMFGKTSQELEKKIASIGKFEIKEEEFGEFSEQAKDSVKTVVKTLGTMLAQTKFMEEQAQTPETLESVGYQANAPIDDNLPSGEYEQPIEQRLAKTFADTPEEKEVKTPTYAVQTRHESMIKDVKFWCEEYRIINSEYSDLMNILNKYTAI